jgi:hypothetical protein
MQSESSNVERHIGHTPSVMIWGAMGYSRQSSHLRIQGTKKINHYIREILDPEVLSLIRVTSHFIFQQDNAGPHVARVVQAFLE